jgi:hypothetical protein
MSTERIVNFIATVTVSLDEINADRDLIGLDPLESLDDSDAEDYAAQAFEARFGLYPHPDDFAAEVCA